MARAAPTSCPPAPTAGCRTRPFLKWVGGKARLVPSLLAHFPARFGRYHEPFVGGGAAFFALAPPRATLADVNAELIAAYTAVRDDVEAVIAALGAHVATPEHFYAVRAQLPESLPPPARAARTIYLNRLGYNGLYRVNSRGIFNVPYGRHVRPRVCRALELRAASAALRGVELVAREVAASCVQARRGDLVYFDPPYDPVSRTARFVAYAQGGFGRDDQAALAALFAQLAGGGVHVVLSNADTPFVRELYRGFRITAVMARRAISRDGAGRGPVPEVIVSAT